MLNLNSTTSRVFCCTSCGAPVALVVQLGGDVTYQCQNACCQRVISVDCPEALQVREFLELPVRASVTVQYA